ncbi:MAG: glycosyltransferase family 25 protein [Planctomycetota bacterium]
MAPEALESPVYVINLDRSPARLAHMTRVLHALGIDFERIPAVDGRQLTAVDRQDTPLQPGEHGCFLSHRQAWRCILERGAEVAIVLEDDVVPHPVLAELVRGGLRLPPDIDVLKLDTTWERVRLGRRVGAAGGTRWRRLASVHWATGGYAVSRAGAGRLLAGSGILPPRDSVDAYLYLPVDDARRVAAGWTHVPRAAQCIPAPLISAHRVGDDPALASTLAVERAPLSVAMVRARRPRSRTVAARLRKNLSRPFRRLASHTSRLWTAQVVDRLRPRVPYADGRTAWLVDGKPVRRFLDERQA